MQAHPPHRLHVLLIAPSIKEPLQRCSTLSLRAKRHRHQLLRSRHLGNHVAARHGLLRETKLSILTNRLRNDEDSWTTFFRTSTRSDAQILGLTIRIPGFVYVSIPCKLTPRASKSPLSVHVMCIVEGRRDQI